MPEHNDEFWTVYAKCKESRTRKYMNLVYLFKLIVLFSLVESTGQNNNNNYNDKLANDCPNCNIY